MNIEPLIAANWKMYKTPSEAALWAAAFLERLATAPKVPAAVAICPPATHLAVLGPLLEPGPVALGAQDVSAHDEGAYTGEISAAMLADLGVRYVIVGHSERRAHHAEDDAMVNAKLKAVRGQGMCPILCVGEHIEERQAGRARDVVLRQLRAGLAGIEAGQPGELVIAYEPVWAIGTGRTATTEDAQEMCAAIREVLQDILGPQAGKSHILYGGSMKPGNAAELLAQPDIGGGLVGSASLDVADFLAIVGAAGATHA